MGGGGACNGYFVGNTATTTDETYTHVVTRIHNLKSKKQAFKLGAMITEFLWPQTLISDKGASGYPINSQCKMEISRVLEMFPNLLPNKSIM